MSHTIPDALRQAFANKTLIPIVGAGVSMSLQKKGGGRLFPSWKGLLEQAAERIKREGDHKNANLVNAFLDADDYQQAADYARKGLSGALWSQFFKEVFSVKRADIDDASLVLPRAIWELGERVITLNYDKVLRFACPCPDDVDELDNTATVELADFNRNVIGKPAIWHLHGKLANLKEIIFTSESYSNLYLAQTSDYKAALEIFRALCRDTHLLFVGCSLEDAELLAQIGRQHALFAGNTGPHYALVREAQRDEIQRKLNGLNITLVCFADFGQPLLDTIAAIRTVAPAPAHTPAATSAPVRSAPAPAGGKRIALLRANPIGENYDYADLLGELTKFKCEICHFPLTVTALNALENFDYIVILSVLIKNRIVIEDDALQSARSGFKELEDNIGNGATQGVFYFLNHTDRTALDATGIAADLDALALPTLIFPAMDKSLVGALPYQLFQKGNLDVIAHSVVKNRTAFKLGELNSAKKSSKQGTPLPDSIDPKTTRHYVGRQADLQNICHKIVALQGINEVLTIKGSGGIGKTMTVKKIAVALAERKMFAEGIDFIDCEFIGDCPSFIKKVVACFNIGNTLEIKNYIKTHFSRQDKLIILDNVETLLHLPDSTDTVGIKDFIQFICDYATIVITSRELLKLECEQRYPLERFNSDEAYALFTQHLRREISDEAEQRFVRQEIVETLLDNNPLAITLVANNIPASKNFSDLKQELEDDLFRKASNDELPAFDQVANNNIERKKSLYASIHFSYRHLTEGEKIAFELLSLFPSGIDMEALKRIANNQNSTHLNIKNTAQGMEPILPTPCPMITDVIIKSLEDKSMTQTDHHVIKLQSIVGKFSEHQFHRRDTDELAQHYQRACAYNMAFAQDLIHDISWKGLIPTDITFIEHQANFLKCIGYLGAARVDVAGALEYLQNLGLLSIKTTTCSALVEAIKRARLIQYFTQDTIAQRLLDVIVLNAQFFSGEFDKAFTTLEQVLPLNTLATFVPRSAAELSISRTARNIYGMEGEVLFELQVDIQTKYDYTRRYPYSLFRIGEFNQALLATCITSFFTLEAKLASGCIDHDMVDDYIATMYEKNHLELMQTNYIKAKMEVTNLQNDTSESAKKRIRRLTVVNPYARGLQALMLAFATVEVEEKIALFEQALPDLQHIKYYYVEGLLFYARYLQAIVHQSRFNEIHRGGLDLACRHHYRWLRYQFEDLTQKKTAPYCAADYPLPEALDIDGYINHLITHNRA